MRTNENWIQTYSGRQYWPTDPMPEDISIVDIAHHLSNICRYTGACRKFYSVAQHSVLMSRMELIIEADLEWLALLHDAAEAYTGDFSRPVKRTHKQMKFLDTINTVAVLKRFELDGSVSFPPFPPEIEQADRILLATERRDLMARLPRPWISTEQVRPLHATIVPQLPMEAKEAFLNRVRELKIRR